MKAVFLVVIVSVSVMLGCSAENKSDEIVPSANPTPLPKQGVGDAATQKIVTNQQSKNTCEWFTELITDVNSGLITGVQGDLVTIGETRYRIKNMYGLSIGSQEPIHPRVKSLMGKTDLKFEFEDVRPEIDALREACAQHGFPVPELVAQQ